MNETIKQKSYNALTREEDLDKIVYPCVKQYLIDNNMEIGELAEKCCMTISNLRNFLRHRPHRPRTKILKKIVEATNLTIPQLLQSR